MVADIVSSFFGGSILGPGWVLGMSVTVYSSALREPTHGKQYRPVNQAWFLWLFVPFLLIFVLKTIGAFRVGTMLSVVAIAGQSLVAVICLALTAKRVRNLPERDIEGDPASV
jgi:hypothetical protein